MLRLNSFKCNVRNSALALGLILTAGLSSCEEKGLDLYGENREDVEATFITTIRPSTRMSDDKWESGDAIGVFAISNGENLSDSSIYNNYKNIKYINKSDGSIANFEAAETAIKYPDTKEMLDFTAYYPYTDTGYIGVNDFSLSVNVSQQSPHSAIDILYAKATGYNIDNPEVDLHFTHSLSQFCLNITASEDISLEGVEINIINAVTQGVMNLKDGTVTPSEISGDTIKPVINYDSLENRITATAIMIPGWNLSDAETVVQTPNGNIYTLKPDISELLPNKRIICSYKLTPKTVVVIPGGITILPWEDISEETIHEVEPDDTEATIPAESDKSYTGDGTSDFPYSVAEAISNQGDTEVWVKGYIVGFADCYNSETYELSNKYVLTNSTESIVLADIPTEEDITKMLPVKFGVGSDAKDRLNLKENEDARGREVMILCNLEEVYNSPGGNNIIDYKLI